MGEKQDLLVEMLSRTTVPPLRPVVRQRALALARSNLGTAATGRRDRLLDRFTPPGSLVPSLLISAGAAFVVNVCIKAVRLFWIS